MEQPPVRHAVWSEGWLRLVATALAARSGSAWQVRPKSRGRELRLYADRPGDGFRFARCNCGRLFYGFGDRDDGGDHVRPVTIIEDLDPDPEAAANRLFLEYLRWSQKD